MLKTTFQNYYALLGGSFDPFHNGHLHIAEQILGHTAIDKLIFLPCGRHNFKRLSVRLDFETRFQLIRKAIVNMPRMEAWDEDSETKGSGYTSDLMRRIYINHPDKRFCFIIGSDNVNALPQWHDFEWLRHNVELLVVPRPGYHIDEAILDRVKATMVSIPLSDISSAMIRSRLDSEQPISGLVPAGIELDIIKLYAKKTDLT